MYYLVLRDKDKRTEKILEFATMDAAWDEAENLRKTKKYSQLPIGIADSKEEFLKTHSEYALGAKKKSDEKIEKSRTHKYIKREGTPGHYRYFYAEDFRRKVSKKKKIVEKIKEAVKQHMLYHGSTTVKHDELYDIIGHLLEGEHLESKTPISVLVSAAKKEIGGIEKKKRGRPRKSSSGEETATRIKAKKETKAALDDKEEYAFARESNVNNAGEDIVESARHKRNKWKGLEEAERDGEAEKLVTRDKLLKNEPFSVMDSVDSFMLGSLAAHYAVHKFVAAPKTNKIKDDDPYIRYKDSRGNYVYFNSKRGVYQKLEKINEVDGSEYKKFIRSVYYQAFNRIQDSIKKHHKTNNVPEFLTKVRNDIKEMLKEIRKEDYYNPVANQLVDYHNKVLDSFVGRRTPKNNVMRLVAEFSKKVQHATSVGGKKSDNWLDDLKDATKMLMEGQKEEKIFNEKKENKKRLTTADLYVKWVKRKGPETKLKTTKSQIKHIIEKNKIRGLQWGNSVTDEEREHHTKNIAEAFVDLADVLGIDSEKISYNGKLGLAVGARGKGGASAHYEPKLVVINLTRKNGVGSLAHEWGHMFDNLLNKSFESSFGRNVSEHIHVGVEFSPNMPEGQKEIYKAMGQIQLQMADMKEKIFKMSDEDFYWYGLGQSKQYWASNDEIFARYFESYVNHKLEKKGRKNTYLSGVKEHPFWPDKEEIKKIEPLMDNFFEVAKKSGYFEKAMVYFEDLEKGRKPMPIGTISGKYKKVADGKWIPVAESDKEAKNMKVKFTDELLGMQSGQKDLRLSARTESGKTIGKIDYTDYHGDVSIKMIEVRDEFRGKGVAIDLFKELVKKVPYEKIDWGMLTQGGSKLKEKLDKIFDYKPEKKRNPKDLVKKFNGKILEENIGDYKGKSVDLYVEFSSLDDAKKFAKWAEDIGSEHAEIQEPSSGKKTAWVDVSKLPIIEKEASARKIVNKDIKE